ncbi:hypothetical protein DSLASN_49420 [Desulfoluna limicola]|uniref:DNA mismatch repair proteins mutS family domain-containing protein n=1 Tax=Desulfoluna limicola TaxID=2810562 RepID=A0ABM7PQ09_9BACT|nr:hypothetical protein [Desulfoluna limicola]BCS99310.1 hypothetical protein DSLASN_49420 [Desulfoluna limicola]
MALEFRQEIIPDALKEELAFDGYLSLFDLGLPLIPATILEPMKREAGLAHFEALKKVEAAFAPDTLSELIKVSRRLPLLESLLPHFEGAALQQFHLFELNRFLTVTAELTALEAVLPTAEETHGALDGLRRVLTDHTERGGAALKTDEATAWVKAKLEGVEKKLHLEILAHEKAVEEAIGLRMIYPFPREIQGEGPILEKARTCALLRVTETGETFRVDHHPGETLAVLSAEKETLTRELEGCTATLLAGINAALVPFFEAFFTNYEERKKRCHLYTLVFVKQQEGFAFPEFETGCRLSLTGGLSFALSRKKGKANVPLTINLDQGANVLYGANMSGKTTVLKTLYFLLTAIRTGLPVPAEAITLHYPESVQLLLKSSGDMGKDLSSFGEELHFFSREPEEGAFILADELFLSTDPVNGAELSRIFIDNYGERPLIFFCTTHYPKVLEMKTPHLFRMLDVAFADGEGKAVDLSNLASLMPYRLEKITSENAAKAAHSNRKPLELALCFPLPESIKQSIREQIDTPYPTGRDSK